MKRKILITISTVLAIILASCSMETRALSLQENNQSNTSTPTTPTEETEPQFPERADEWLSMPPMVIEYLEGEGGTSPVKIIGGEFNLVERWGIGIYIDDIYAVDLNNTFITFDGVRRPMANGVEYRYAIVNENNWLVSPSRIWLINSDKPYADKVKAYSQTTGKFIPAYDVLLEITIIPEKGASPVFYKIHAYPDGWTNDEFPIENWYKWAEEKFGATE